MVSILNNENLNDEVRTLTKRLVDVNNARPITSVSDDHVDLRSLTTKCMLLGTESAIAAYAQSSE